MAPTRREVLKLLASAAVGVGLHPGPASAEKAGIIARDVAVIGGGSAGIYAAIRLRDLGHSVVVLERSTRIGGHAETFHDPLSGIPIDIGVIIFPDNDVVRGYFHRFGVPLITAQLGGGPSQFVDFRGGDAVDAFNPAPAEVGAALFKYLTILTTEFGFLEQSGFRLPGPGAVLDQLLQPFGQFVTDHGLEALVPTFFLFVQGFGPLLDATTLYVLKNMSASVVSGMLGGTFLTAPTGSGSLYQAASTALGGDVILGAKVVDVDRRARRPIRVRARTTEGLREVRAHRLLVTSPPLLANFAGFDLDSLELATFAEFRSERYWTSVARIGNLDPGLTLVNAASDTPYNLAPLPGIYSIGPTRAPGLFDVKYGGGRSDHRVRAAIEADIERVSVPGVGPLSFDGFAVFKNHSPYMLHVSPRQIAVGFYRQLAALQGRNDTFYAGAAFQTHDSAAIWSFLEELLPTLFA